MANHLKYSIFKTKWGFFGLLADEKGLLKTSLPMPNIESVKKHLLVGTSNKANKVENLYHNLEKAVIDYCNGSYVDFQALKITLNEDKLTAFSRRVLKACQKIKIGEVATYGQLAMMAGYPGAARAVGSVMAKNQWPLIIGCHRIIKSDGSIGNFSFGRSKTKKLMIEHEQKIKNQISKLRKKNDTDKEN
jgi:methylated-DNA-[protein]-cysteine S-methyltransferase